MRTLFISLMIGLGVAHTGLGDAQVKTLVHGGRTRSYRVHLPPSYREGLPMALVFALHGYGGTAAGFEKTTGFSRIADREGFMAYHLGARLPGRFAAIAPWGSLLAYNDSMAGSSLSVIHFHGARDKDVLYNGMPKWGFFGVEYGIRLWAKRNRCKSSPVVIRDDPNALVRRWEAPKGIGDVVLYKLKY